MKPEQPPRLIDRLRCCADIWVASNAASLARLGRAVLNDSSYFNRTESPQGTTTATLEKFARFLGDGGNWPDGAVPREVCEFVHVVGVSSEACAAAPDASSQNIDHAGEDA